MREGTSKKEEKDRDFQVEEDFKKEKMKIWGQIEKRFFLIFFYKGFEQNPNTTTTTTKIIIIKLVLNKLTIQVNIHAPSRIANVV